VFSTNFGQISQHASPVRGHHDDSTDSGAVLPDETLTYLFLIGQFVMRNE
jgi:hypothetical protein